VNGKMVTSFIIHYREPTKGGKTNVTLAFLRHCPHHSTTNVQQADDAEFAGSVSGVAVKAVGEDRHSYRGLLAEIERLDRDCCRTVLT
jgi:hypothetical protein